MSMAGIILIYYIFVYMNIIKNLAFRFFISIAFAQGLARIFPKYEDLILISLTIALYALLSYLAKKF
ncbi:hypothetical protein GCM10023315_18880 [Algibacter aquimarinus]|uniref:Uncharacterized protein n=1 Tax=Algibacter aquimarinus TaxID=1136748 RepID=A0ABP9HEU9_9FLAO